MEWRLIATAAFGLEAVVARELENLGAHDVRTHNGYVEFTGDAMDVARANLWLRAADRVLLKVGQFHADTFDALFEQTKALPWPELLPADAHFPVTGRSVKSVLASVPACQSIVKKAIVESLKRKYKMETFPETGPTYRIEVALHKDEALLTIDTSGPGLHRRGYRTLNGPAPLRETLAAALVLLSRWLPHRPFADPMCGSGTIAVEAALIARNIAPGLRRTFAAEAFSFLPRDVWRWAREEAEAAIRQVDADIWASDIDPEAVRLTEFHCRQAKILDCVRIVQQDVAHFRPQAQFGCIVTNPPYGERLGNPEDVAALYGSLGRVFRSLDTWSAFILTAHPRFERLYGRTADKRRKLYNGRLETQLYQYLGPLPPLPK